MLPTPAGRGARPRLPPITVRTVRAELAGRDLACWCPLDEPCHADVLIEVAAGPLPPSSGPHPR